MVGFTKKFEKSEEVADMDETNLIVMDTAVANIYNHLILCLESPEHWPRTL